MRALITGTPLQVEGEPAEIAQLVELMSTGAVMVEHVHHFRLGLPDDQGIQEGVCWCGTKKSFAPWGDPSAARQTPVISVKGAEKRAEFEKKARTCKHCGIVGHDRRKCPELKAAA